MMQMRTMGSSYYFFNNIGNNIDKLILLTPTHPNLVEFTSNLEKAAKNTTSKVKHIVKLSHIRADAVPLPNIKLFFCDLDIAFYLFSFMHNL